MATPDMTLITRAEVTSITTAATGRKAFTLDGATIELGDTGLRDLSGMFVAGKVASGRALVRRAGNTVTWFFAGVNLAAGTTNNETIINIDSNVAQFAPKYTAGSTVLAGGTEIARVVANASGSVSVLDGLPGYSYTGSLTYLTDKTWPATLPGVADGQPIGV